MWRFLLASFHRKKISQKYRIGFDLAWHDVWRKPMRQCARRTCTLYLLKNATCVIHCCLFSFWNFNFFFVSPMCYYIERFAFCSFKFDEFSLLLLFVFHSVLQRVKSHVAKKCGYRYFIGVAKTFFLRSFV